MNQLNWGIIGTGAIAKAFAHGLQQSKFGNLAAVGSRTKASAEAFTADHPDTTAHGSYEALLEDEAIQAVYISTPHPFHAEWAIKAVEAGKHVLCEKPATLNQWQAQSVIEAARKAGLYFSEAFMYRFHPQTRQLVELIQSNAIGEVRMIRASFGFGGGDSIDSSSRLFDPQLGGGGILDVGCYAASVARLVAGAAIGKPFDNPVSVKGGGKVGETGVDEWAAAVLQFSSGITAQVATATRASLDNALLIVGSKGTITVPNPWTADRENPVNGRIVVNCGDESKEHEIPTTATSFALEADGVAEAIASGRCEPESPAMTWDDTLGNMAVLDAWRKEIGLVYPQEKPVPCTVNLAGKPVGVRTSGLATKMPFGKIPGLEKPVSKFIFGALTAHGSYAKGQVLFDHWLEVGGNTIDTGYVYRSDGILGQWINSRGIREEIVIIAKGAHTPHCNPEGLTRELFESLEQLKTDYTDIYIMHRDNEDIPVGEFIDVLNEHVAAGRIRAFGGSNWSPERFMAANEYAAANGKQGMAVLNNNLSLARMVDPVWAGCLHMSDKASRDWLTKNKVVHLAWSSQARGFFTGRTDQELAVPGYDPELRRCWLSDDNLARRKRCIELAEQKGVLPINIAAAYVLCQPFESYALIGPETVHEMETSLPALDVRLTNEELEFLWGSD